MCGLFALTIAPGALRAAFGLAEAVDCPPRAVIRPSEPVLAIRRDRDGLRHARLALWGFVPHWMKDWPSRRPINARAETIFTKPFFRAAARHRRCLIPADGFHEWTGEKGHKHAWLFRRRDGRPLAMAGLWENWLGADGSEVETCVIITTGANADVAPIHERMPALLPSRAWDAWLDPATPARDAAALLAPAPPGLLSARDTGNPLRRPPGPQGQGGL